MAPSNSSTSSIKELSAALIAFFAPPISIPTQTQITIPSPHPPPPPPPPPGPVELFAQVDCFLDQLRQLPPNTQSRPSSQALSQLPSAIPPISLSSPDLAQNRAHLAALLNSLRQLWLARPSHLLAPTLLALLDKITLDHRARPLLAQIDYSLTHTWWASLLLPSLTSFANSLSPAAEHSLVNLLVAALAANPHAPLPPPAPPLALELFALYKREHACPGRTTAKQSLLTWGKVAPKDLFALIDALVASPAPEPERADDQTYALTLLIDFATSSPYSIHNLLSTSLIPSLLRIILDPHPPAAPPLRLATDALLLILPRVPTAIDGCLALLLIALARLLCWPRSPGAPPDAERTLEPAQTALFGLLYGLAPCTLAEFVRSPADALAALAARTPPAGAPPVDPAAVDAPLLRRLVIPLAAQHRLAQDLLINTPEAERTAIAAGGLNRFESAELIERCERNAIVEACQAPEPMPLPVPLLWSKPGASAEEGSVEELRHENTMLKNKLNVERYLKQQHLQQMGSLHKQNILGAGLEAENRNLHVINKELQRKLEEALDRLYNSPAPAPPPTLSACSDSPGLSNETPSTTMTTAKNVSPFRQLSNQQSINYREQIIKLGESKKELVHRLKYTEELFRAQKDELSCVETDAHALRNELKLLQPRLDSLQDLEAKNSALSRALLTWDDDLRRFRESRKQIDVLRAEWKRFESLACASEIENQKLRAELRAQAEQNQHLRAENKALRETRRSGSTTIGGGEEVCRAGSTAGREWLVGSLKRTVEELRAENVRLKVGCEGGGGRTAGVDGVDGVRRNGGDGVGGVGGSEGVVNGVDGTGDCC